MNNSATDKKAHKYAFKLTALNGRRLKKEKEKNTSNTSVNTTCVFTSKQCNHPIQNKFTVSFFTVIWKNHAKKSTKHIRKFGNVTLLKIEQKKQNSMQFGLSSNSLLSWKITHWWSTMKTSRWSTLHSKIPRPHRSRSSKTSRTARSTERRWHSLLWSTRSRCISTKYL